MMAWLKGLGRCFSQGCPPTLDPILPLPNHIAIIMDGNGRWAQKSGASRLFGHKKGVDIVRSIVRCAGEIGIKNLTLYTFSYENWKRPKEEVEGLLDLIRVHLMSELPELKKNNVKVKVIGELHMLPFDIQEIIEKVKNQTESNTGLVLSLALSYSSRQEIISTVKTIFKDIENKKINPYDLDEESFSKYLYTSYAKDPELIIRTSGEQRLSNFLLWQSAYSEFYFSKLYWPEFSKEEFLKAIKFYQSRNRRYGGI